METLGDLAAAGTGLSLAFFFLQQRTGMGMTRGCLYKEEGLERIPCNGGTFILIRTPRKLEQQKLRYHNFHTILSVYA